MRALSLLAVLATTLPSLAAAQSITRGPYLQNVTRDSVVVVWEQDSASTAEVRYGTTDALGEIDSSASSTRHEVTVSGLSANADYRYGVYINGTAASETYRLPTAVSATDPFRFVVFGDTRSNAADHGQVIAAVAAEPDVRFVINTGDLVADGDTPSLWDEFFSIELPAVANTPMFPVIGNHDKTAGGAELYVDLFVVPENAPDPEAYYSFNYGNSHIVVLDSIVNVDTVCLHDPYIDCFNQAQLDWIASDLADAHARSEIRHIFVTAHIGPYSSKSGRTGSGQMRVLMPLFAENGVTMVLTGHDHYFEHGLSSNGIPYVITGGGGAPLYDLSSPSSSAHTVLYNESVNHYVVIDVEGSGVHAEAIAPDGRVLDTIDVSAPPECTIDADCSDRLPTCTGSSMRCESGSCVESCPAQPSENAGASPADPGFNADTNSDGRASAPSDEPTDDPTGTSPARRGGRGVVGCVVTAPTRDRLVPAVLLAGLAMLRLGRARGRRGSRRDR